MKIPASRLKAWDCLFEVFGKPNVRYNLIIDADTKERAIKIATRIKAKNMAKGDDPRKDKLIEIKRDYDCKLGGYYKGKMVEI